MEQEKNVIRKMVNVQILCETPDVKVLKKRLSNRTDEIINYIKITAEKKEIDFLNLNNDTQKINHFHINYEDEEIMLSAQTYIIHSLEKNINIIYEILNKLATNKKALKNNKGKLNKIIKKYEKLITEIENFSFGLAVYFMGYNGMSQKELFNIFLQNIEYGNFSIYEELYTLENKLSTYLVDIRKCDKNNFSKVEKIQEHNNNLKEVFTLLYIFLIAVEKENIISNI